MTNEVPVSERRACGLVGGHRSSLRYQSRRRTGSELLQRLRELAQEHPRWGYRLLGDVLRLHGINVNHKRLYRIYKAEGLRLPRRRPRRGPRPRAIPLQTADRPNQQVSLDFVSDSFSNGRRFRCLTLIDEYTRESPTLVAATSFSGKRVTRILDELAATRGYPEVLRLDNGPEFTSAALHCWARQNHVRLHFIDPGKPTQNAFIERFNGTFRDECLNAHWFIDLADARREIEAWRHACNKARPHSSLGRIPPAVYIHRLATRCGNRGNRCAISTVPTALRRLRHSH